MRNASCFLALVLCRSLPQRTPACFSCLTYLLPNKGEPVVGGIFRRTNDKRTTTLHEEPFGMISVTTEEPPSSATHLKPADGVQSIEWKRQERSDKCTVSMLFVCTAAAAVSDAHDHIFLLHFSTDGIGPPDRFKPRCGREQHWGRDFLRTWPTRQAGDVFL